MQNAEINGESVFLSELEWQNSRNGTRCMPIGRLRTSTRKKDFPYMEKRDQAGRLQVHSLSSDSSFKLLRLLAS